MKDPTPYSVRRLALAAMFLAIALVLPFLTGQLQTFGNMLLPMHLPVMLCGLICGWQYGGAVGFVAPLLRFALFHMPRMPLAVPMAFELAAYGLLTGLLYGLSKRKGVAALYRALLLAMVGGRIVWAAGRTVLAGLGKVPFGWQVFLTAGFLEAIPGILLQLVLIPAVMVALGRAGLVPFGAKEGAPDRA